jgi:ATP-binding cassette subfamily F protein uup
VIAFAGDGQLVEIAGGYSDWQRYRAGLVASAAETAPASAASAATARGVPVSPAVLASTTAPAPAAPAKAKPRLSFKETRELEAMPATIERIEGEIAAVGMVLADPATYTREPAELKALQSKLAGFEDDLARAMQRWEDLEARANEAGAA